MLELAMTVAKYSCATHHLHKIFCALLKTKGKACSAGCVTVTLVEFRAEAGFGVTQGRALLLLRSGSSSWGMASSACWARDRLQLLALLGKGLRTSFPPSLAPFPPSLPPPFFRDTSHKTPGSQDRTECSKCCFLSAVNAVFSGQFQDLLPALVL